MSNQWYKNKGVLIGGGIAAGVVVLVLALVLGVAQWRKGVQNEGEAMQERVIQTYRSAQNSLSTCIDQGTVGAQVAKQQMTEIKDILQAALSARYVDNNGNPAGASEALGTNGSSLISALHEAYPDIPVEVFTNLQTVVVGCRDEYQGSQDRLFNEIQEFQTWIQTDSVFNQGIKAKFPTDVLVVVDLKSGSKLKGQEALDYMSRVIMVADARAAYESGTLEDQDLFGGSN